MRYYHYISDSKLDMLSPQISSSKSSTIKAEIGFNVGLLNGKIATDRLEPSDRIAKLESVERHLKKHESIGTIDDPEQWIEGTADALATRITEDSKAVFYFIRTERTYLALGGSVGHLIGAHPSRKSAFGYSYAEWLIKLLADIQTNPRLFFRDDDAIAEHVELGVEGNNSWVPMIFHQVSYRRDSTFDLPIHFLARRIREGIYRDKRVVLASPLYVDAL